MFCLKPLAGLCLHSLAKKHLRSGKSSIWGLRRVFDCRGGCHPHPHPCLCSSVQLQVLLLYKLVLIRQPSHFCQEPSAGHIPNWVEEEFLAFFHCLPRVLNSSRMKKKQKKTRKASFISDVWNQYVIYLTLQGMKRKKKKKRDLEPTRNVLEESQTHHWQSGLCCFTFDLACWLCGPNVTHIHQSSASISSAWWTRKNSVDVCMNIVT